MVEAIAGSGRKHDKDRSIASECPADDDSGRRTDLYDVLIAIGLIALLVFPPLALGSVAPWARSVAFCVALGLAALWLLQGIRRGRLRIARSAVWLLIIAFFGIGILQLVPLPQGLLRFISPGTADTYGRLLPEGAAGPQPISLFPYGTKVELLRLAALALVFFVVANSVRTRWQASAIVVALVAIALFETLYGFGEQFSGNRHVFWHERQAHLAAVTGTFWNKNHFAGLLEMVLFAGLGLMLGIMPRQRAVGSARTRIAESLSSWRTHAPLWLGIAVTVLAVGIGLSLSRAAIICTVIAFVAFAFCLGLSAGFRKYTLFLFFVITAVLLLAGAIGTEIVVERLEDAASGKSASWGDRMDLAQSGVTMAAHFPLLGTGLGSFRYTFERFQSPRFGDRYADFLHNDWLQIVCESGLIGGAIILAAMVILVWGTLRVALSRRDPFCRWVSLGALFGVLVMLLHSFFDYNLSKITSNGIVFAALLGLSFAVARMPSAKHESSEKRKFLTIPLGPAPVRVALGFLVIGGACLLALAPLRQALANLHMSHFLAASKTGPVDRYFFIPLSESAPGVKPEEALDRAQRLNPANPKHRHWASLFFARKAEQSAVGEAREAARRLLGPDIERRDPDAFDRVSQALAMGINLRPSADRAALLQRSEEDLRHALKMLPVSADYHLQMAQVLLARAAAAGGTNSPPTARPEGAMQHARQALWLAPTKPHILFDAGKIAFQSALSIEDEQARSQEVEKVHQRFRRAILADPSYAQRIYAIVREVSGGSAALRAVTPRNLRSYERLANALWRWGEWEELLKCLDVMEEVAIKREGVEVPASWQAMPKQTWDAADADVARAPFEASMGGEAAYDTRDASAIKLSIAQRRCAVLGIMARWRERRQAVIQYQGRLRETLKSKVTQAIRLREQRRYRDAMMTLLDVLRQDWGNPEALLAAAETGSHYGALDGLPGWNEPLDLLYRLVINNDRLKSKTVEEIQRLLRQLDVKDPPDRVVADFVLGAARVLSGQTTEGIETLRAVAARDDGGAQTWRQRHMIWQYLGLGYELTDNTEKAAEAYGRALALVPNHRPALERLVNLRADYASRLSSLTPSVPCHVEFGGRIIFLGYKLTQEKVPADYHGVTITRDAWFITYYWQLKDRMLRDYQPSIQLCDEQRHVLFTDDHVLRGGTSPYPTDFPRCGEVVIQKRRLREDPTSARYLRVGIYAPALPKPLPNNIHFDSGTPLFVTSLLFRPARRPAGGPAGDIVGVTLKVRPEGMGR